MVSACPRERCYRSPQRASVIFIKMMRIFESRLFWPMAVSFLHTQKLKTSKAASAIDTVPSVIAKNANAPSLMHTSVVLFYDSCSL